MNWNFYTTATEGEFLEMAKISQKSFLKYNSEINYSIDIIKKNYNPINEKYLKKNKYYNILFSKFTDSNLFPQKYNCFVDADTICLKKLDLKPIEKLLNSDYICVISDPMNLKRKNEIINDLELDNLYFNSGVVFFNKKIAIDLKKNFRKWILNNFNFLWKLPHGDQTWLNIYLNKNYKKQLYDIGYWWNLRTLNPDRRAFIWHSGGRGFNGLKKMEEYLNGM